jgi:succinate--hydroxymethylglutarate CoA-transferase
MSQPASISPSSASRASRPIAAKPTVIYGANASERSAQTMAAAHGTFAASNGTSTGANPSSGSTGDSAPSRSPFSFQFSAATEMILKRLRGEGGLLNPNATLGVRPAAGTGAVQPPGYEDVRRSVLQGMKTTLNMELPSSVPPPAKKGPKAATVRTSTPTGVDAAAATTAGSGNIGAPKGKASTKSGKVKAGTKRKRAKDDSDSPEESAGMSGLGGDSDSDDVGSTTQLPTKTLSGRKVVKPAQFDPAALEGPSRKRASYTYKKGARSVEQALCKRCGRAHSPTGNLIVFCDGCNIGWHQMCHDPMVSDDLVKDASKEWFCKECSAQRAKLEVPTPEIGKDPTWSGKSLEEVRSSLALDDL